MKQFTDEQKAIAEAKFKELYHSLIIGVDNYNGPDQPKMAEYQVGTAKALFASSFSWKEGLNLETQAAGAAISLVECMIQTIIPLAEPIDMIMQSKRLREYIRELVIEGNMLEEYAKQDSPAPTC